jgi:hypothetical protein
MMDNLATYERRFELETARRIVGELADLIRPACDRLEVGGSIRRGRPTVKDAELIAIPLNGSANTLHQFLDDLVARGEVEKAVYVDKNGKSSNRWGQKYRGILFQEIKVEIFLATEINWGFQKWLRTGPGDANQYIMAYLIQQRARLRFIDGGGWYSPGGLWHKPKDKWLAADKVQLNIPDEDTFFALLGMPYLPPNERSEERYKQLLQWNRAHQWPEYRTFALQVPEPVLLVDAPTKTAVFGDRLKAGEMTRMSPLAVTTATADEWNKQVYREALHRAQSQLEAARLMSRMYPSYARRAEALERDVEMIHGLISGFNESKTS